MNNLIKQIVESKFNFNIDIEYNDRESLSKSSFNTKSLKALYEESLNIIDLGLPSKTLWCKYNLGVDPNKLNNPEDWNGNYYAWGEIKTKKEYNWNTYKFYDKNKEIKETKYILKDKLVNLLQEDDAAYLNLHINDLKFKIPSEELFEELLDYTTYKPFRICKDISIYGMMFKSKINDKEIFFPAGGIYDQTEYESFGISGRYWTSTLFINLFFNNSTCSSWAFEFFTKTNRASMTYLYRYYGINIRPVLSEN